MRQGKIGNHGAVPLELVEVPAIRLVDYNIARSHTTSSVIASFRISSLEDNCGVCLVMLMPGQAIRRLQTLYMRRVMRHAFKG